MQLGSYKISYITIMLLKSLVYIVDSLLPTAIRVAYLIISSSVRTFSYELFYFLLGLPRTLLSTSQPFQTTITRYGYKEYDVSSIISSKKKANLA